VDRTAIAQGDIGKAPEATLLVRVIAAVVKSEVSAADKVAAWQVALTVMLSQLLMIGVTFSAAVCPNNAATSAVSCANVSSNSES